MTKYENSHLTKHLDSNNIKGTIPTLIQKFEEQYPGAKLIYLTETGSVLHGTNSEESDIDIKGLYIPSIEAFITDQKMKPLKLGEPGEGNNEKKNTAGDIDLEVFPVNFFLDKLSLKMETNAIEIIFSMFTDKVLFETDKSKLLRDNYKDFIYNSTEALTRYAISQAITYSVKGDRLKELEDTINFFNELDLSRSQKTKMKLNMLDFDRLLEGKEHLSIVKRVNKEDIEEEFFQVLNRKMAMGSKVGFFMNFLNDVRETYGERAEKAMMQDGVDFKAFAHAIRAIRQAKELTLTGFLKFPVESAAELKDIKYNNSHTISELTDMMEKEDLELQDLKEYSVLNDIPNFDKVNEIKIKMYEDILNKRLDNV